MLTMYLYTFAQQENCLSTLHLKILDASSGIGIEDVTAYIPQQQKGNHSNQTGELSIEKLCTGEYTLICKHLNHEEKKEKIIAFYITIPDKEVYKRSFGRKKSNVAELYKIFDNKLVSL